MLANSTFAVHRLVPDILRLILALTLGLIACFAPYQSGAQSASWPAFGPDDGFTDTLPDFVGRIDGSAELTIFTEGDHYPVLLPLVLASPWNDGRSPSGSNLTVGALV